MHLAELMRNKGRLIAADVHPNRLARLTPRLTRAKINIVETQVIDEKAGAASFDPNLIGKVDCVLIDAPCSGVGTLRRNVGLKWTSQNLEALTALTHKVCGVPVPQCEATMGLQSAAKKVPKLAGLEKPAHNALTNYLVSLLQSRWRGYAMRKKYSDHALGEAAPDGATYKAPENDASGKVKANQVAPAP